MYLPIGEAESWVAYILTYMPLPRSSMQVMQFLYKYAAPPELDKKAIYNTKILLSSSKILCSRFSITQEDSKGVIPCGQL